MIAFLVLIPFALAFVYSGIHEYLRYKSDGKATYGLVFDEDTGTTHVTGIADEEIGYDPDDFDPNNYNDPDIKDDPDDSTA